MITSSVVASGYRPARQRITTETKAALAAMTVQPSEKRIFVYDVAIRSLKAAGLWSKLGWLSLLAAHDEQAGRLNLVAPSQVMTAVNSPGFTVDHGFKGDGASSYLVLALPPAMGMAAGNAAFGAGVRTGGTTVNPLIGQVSGTNSFEILWPSNASSRFTGRMNSATAVTFGAVTSRAGRFVMSKVATDTTSGYLNGALVQSVAAATESDLSTQANPTTLFRQGSTYADDEVSFVHFGKGMTAPDVAAFDAIMTTYLQGVGAA
ncbi:hypothetical protein SAMN05216548_1316 [Faunimonas pinastri]|uniref:Uncharacterized protein n=1 Tax=Faunimonas pinastri TaxID=1855383 RepID=A0A1H9QN25_9HYPH|nr:hypothetical protein [Faunimonas pinastri]SER61862.1 hypothetical protein SAMN05216548_1316 [Faunimonas pinastri]